MTKEYGVVSNLKIGDIVMWTPAKWRFARSDQYSPDFKLEPQKGIIRHLSRIQGMYQISILFMNGYDLVVSQDDKIDII